MDRARPAGSSPEMMNHGVCIKCGKIISLIQFTNTKAVPKAAVYCLRAPEPTNGFVSLDGSPPEWCTHKFEHAVAAVESRDDEP